MTAKELSDYMESLDVPVDAWGKTPPEFRLSERRDLAAFILLDRICEGRARIVDAAEHDCIWLGVDVEDLAGKATEDDLKYLKMCGVHVSVSDESLCMFV